MHNDPRQEGNVEGDSIDLVSVDEASGCALLHLLVKGPWSEPENTLHWVRRRLNVYIAFVLSGQMRQNPRYGALKPKFLVHCECVPPPIALTTFARMREHLGDRQIAFGVTVGPDVKTEVALPDAE